MHIDPVRHPSHIASAPTHLPVPSKLAQHRDLPRNTLFDTVIKHHKLTYHIDFPAILRATRAALNLTQKQLAKRLGVCFTTVNRWESGGNTPQHTAQQTILALAQEAGGPRDRKPPASRSRRASDAAAHGASGDGHAHNQADGADAVGCRLLDPRRKGRSQVQGLPAALTLLFLKRLSDVFDDEITRLAEEYGDCATALEIAESDHSLLRFYLPPQARWAVISGRKSFNWPLDEDDRPTAPRDIGEHLTKDSRAVVKQNPTLSGVIDIVDFAVERNSERDINPAKLRGVVETFSDPRYRLGLAHVQPDFLGRAYAYLLRKFTEGSGQSAGEFFTPTKAGFLMAHILRPKSGDACHDYACDSGGLLIKLQIVCPRT
ncbi:hypothetical protein D934_02260 [Xylella fastidiosa subsp. sandyi Ann-1]|uniref:site-specific DNA-methyltransferase (adenine-specific) n=1 Tax=Xylella fastidiosa subsp. sandyi Ann-1 TaxID=155920 RepID=A0A060H904_XYLFS|nr:N-6 DNA methylase [Xylella fastidiosa]AIC09392.1 hypothetical protein D934_02260 [Xylella fastidiosa subsp. sandyi Ann-1]